MADIEFYSVLDSHGYLIGRLWLEDHRGYMTLVDKPGRMFSLQAKAPGDPWPAERPHNDITMGEK